MTEDLITSSEGTIITVVKVPLHSDGPDSWLNLFHAMCLRYCEPPADIDPAIVDSKIHELKQAVLAEYGLHLNV